MTNFTPGPWNLYKNNTDDYRHFDITGKKLDSQEFELICSVEGADAIKPTVEDRANSRLIAAAPDLYFIAKELVEWERDPDRFGGDLADLAQAATKIISRITKKF